jgi:predicted transcriptional regulator
MFGGMAMSTLTIRLPDDTAERLKALARSRGLSTNKLVEQLSAHALAAWDTENHFRALAATGDVNRALAILDRLDAEDSRAGRKSKPIKA